MRRGATVLGVVLLGLFAPLAVVPIQRASAGDSPTFRISIDPAAWKKFGFQYPATYIFRIAGLPPNVEVHRRDGDSPMWASLPKKTAEEFFNGIQCVRFDAAAKRAYVSVGFQYADTIELKFAGAASAEFEGIARYYDNRKAAYTLSLDNWGCNPWAHPGAAWRGPTDDESDNYQAALHVCRSFHLPVTIAINSRSAGGESTWKLMQEELDRGDQSWEPAVHGQTHPKNAEAYAVRGYRQEILGCREDILGRLKNIPFGQHTLEHILTHGYCDDAILSTDAGEFLFVRGFNWNDNPASTDFAPWDEKHRLYGVGGLNTKGYDTKLESRDPKGRFSAEDVADLNQGFEKTRQSGGIFYALWHPDRFQNSVLYDPRPGKDGVQGSTLMQHLAFVANRKDIWYVANGWMYSYHFVAEHAKVAAEQGR
ncbi:MAG: hypothetical protein HUU20_29655 [Pirellulales bacterium]|nr:hypothetical protein [Pirellulales bacterium]